MEHSYIDIDNLEIENYEDLEKLIGSLINLKYEYERKRKKADYEILRVSRLIAKRCDENGGHEWVTERENCLYGERYTYCKKCRCDVYDSSYRH